MIHPVPEPRLLALLWDVDGTLAETEMEGHRLAFNAAFAGAGLPWRWGRQSYRRQLAVAGGQERIAAFLARMEGCRSDPTRLVSLQAAKQQAYAALVARGAIHPRAGVTLLMEAAAAAGITQAVVTTSSRAAVSALAHSTLPQLFECCAFWICGDDVRHKKPHPEAYQRALAMLEHQGLGSLASLRQQVLVIEDSSNGLRAAHGAGLGTVITRSAASAQEDVQAFDQALAICDGLDDGQVNLSWLESLLHHR